MLVFPRSVDKMYGTFRDRSALMMTTWKYHREQTRLGYQRMECLSGRLCSHMGGVRSLPGATATPIPPADGRQYCQRVAVVWVEEIPAGDASGAEPPYATTDRKRPIDLPEVAGKSLSSPPPPELL